ncbi:MAG: response regulator [Ktedonobacteraceae bacterium]
MSNTFDKLSILDSFIEEVNSYLPEIETNLERLAQLPSDMEALEETYRRTHTIGGSASMMDFPGLAHVAHGMEDILGDVLEGLAALDAPTLGLLQRSFKRTCVLLQGVRGGVDENAIIAEDDADYVQYRTYMDAAAQASYGNGTSAEQSQVVSEPLGASASLPSMPSLDEVLASFHTPPVSDDGIEWPEETVHTAPQEAAHVQESSADVATPSENNHQFQPTNPSTLEMLASAAHPTFAQEMLPATPTPRPPIEDEVEAMEPTGQPVFYEPSSLEDARSLPISQVSQHAAAGSSEVVFAQAYNEVQEETQSLEAQASSLKEMLAQLRAAMSIIEMQRAEFKGFLNGSKDALDRMEDWAGQAMGLNLRNSPDQVRRYLPLSVMWVSNSKLKKVLDLLKHITSGVQMTDEQLRTVLQQLSASILSCGEAFQQLQSEATESSPVLRQEPGWTPWEMQTTREEDALRERVTFERRGDLQALRSEIEATVREEIRREQEAVIREELRREQEATVREEIRREYENRPLTLAARTELEQQLRTEIRQEFEARRQLQESVSGSGYAANESTQELADRLRSEIEIQVRQEFLNQITVEGADTFKPAMQQSLMPPVSSVSRTSNFADKARQAAGLSPIDTTNDEEPQELPPIASVTMPSQQPAMPQAQITSAPPLVPPVPQHSSQSAALFTEFSEEASEIFRLEAEEHLQTIIMHVAALEKSPEDRELIQGIRRATHTLKGAAGMMGFRAIADLSHIFEDLLESAMEGTTAITPEVVSLVLDTAETLDTLIMGKENDPRDEEAKVQQLRVRYAELLGEQSTTLGIGDEEDIDPDEANDEELLHSPSMAAVIGGNQPPETNAQRAARGDLSVRVRLEKLDELVNLFGEMLVNRSILEERVSRLVQLVADAGVSSTRLRDVGQKLESRFEAATLPSGRSVQVMPGEGTQGIGNALSSNGNGSQHHAQQAHLDDFDELELDRYTEFHQLARGLSEGISDMTTLSTEMEVVIRESEGVFARENRLNTTFQDRLMKARLVPLSTMTPRLYRAARAVALKQHKEFTFLLEGEETEVDRTVNEEIAGPLLHLMRNAVNHAIETPDVRVQKGKPPVGQIKLSAAYEGNLVVITVRDDGVGIDPERVRKAAIARGMIGPNQVLNDNDIIDFIFRPGFSTAEVLSEESGRGVGLDVVRDSVSRLRGTLEVESMPGQGTAFTMRFPTSLAIQSAMMVKVGDQQFAIPTVMVEAIGRLDNYKRATQAGRPAIVVQNDLYPLNMLSQLLSLPVGLIDDKAPVLLINAAGNRVALVVDEIRGKLDVVMKNLGPHLRSVQGIAGGTVMGNGRVVLVLELSELLSVRSKLVGTAVGAPARRDTMSAASFAQTPSGVSVVASQKVPAVAKPPVAPPRAEPERGKHILVVDDSPSVRRVVGNMLKQHGWEVQMARDGVEALDLISRQTPAAVLLDIEMPRMDGYELIATVRAQEQYRTLPMVVLTSRAATKHQQRAIQLGASSYVVKPYQDEELINTLNTLIYGAAAR